jgi:basic membrane protein A
MKTFILFVSSLVTFWTMSFAMAADSNGFKVGLVLDKGGKDDRSFNSSAFQGAEKFKKERNTFLKYVEAMNDDFEPLLRSLAEKNYSLIIAIGVSQAEAVKKIAGLFPKLHFVVVDGEVQAPNVRSLIFEEHEGSFLVGAIAAWTSKTGKLGYIGGMDIPIIRRFGLGFLEGVRWVNPKASVVSNYIGVTADAWNNPAKAKELALTQYNTGIDVIFAAAGASNTGLFDAAEEKKKYAIGVDSNQNWVKPGYVLTSMVKRIDQAVYTVCDDTFNGKFTGGVQRLGLKNNGVDYALDAHNEKLLSAEVRKKAEDLKAKIIAGKVRVSDYYKLKK